MIGTDSPNMRIVANFALARGLGWMMVLMCSDMIEKALQVHRINVGFTKSRIKRWEERRKGRCPRCLVEGHTNRKYTNSRDMCPECWLTGHRTASCKSSHEEKSEFQEGWGQKRLVAVRRQLPDLSLRTVECGLRIQIYCTFTCTLAIDKYRVQMGGAWSNGSHQ